MIVGLAQASAHAIPLRDEVVQTVVTSPPYWGLRSYAGEQVIPEWGYALGLEPTPELYVEHMVAIFREVRRVLRPDGTLWLNLGDSYANDGKWGGETGGKQAYLPAADRRRDGRAKRSTGLKPKDMVGIPWMVAFALRADGWWLRSDIVWSKPNPMPESVTDRPTKAHEYLFLITKSQRYYYDADAVKERSVSDHPSGNGYKRPEQLSRGGRGADEGWEVQSQRNLRSVWHIATQPYPGAHFATYPEKLVEPCILAGSARGDVVLDPFNGSGTTGRVAIRHGRSYVGLDVSREYLVEQSQKRMTDIQLEAAL